MAHTSFPGDLPVPEDDGACSHLDGFRIPPVSLSSTSGIRVDPSKLQGLAIIFCYPRTGAPGEQMPDEWNVIPGARGCTPQACGFRDEMDELRRRGVNTIFGISTQDTPYQQEVKTRVHLPYELLSDADLQFTEALNLPTFEWQGERLIKRLALAVQDGQVINVWYPVFPPDTNAKKVVAWLAKKS